MAQLGNRSKAFLVRTLMSSNVALTQIPGPCLPEPNYNPLHHVKQTGQNQLKLNGRHIRISCLEISPFMIPTAPGRYSGLTNSIFQETSTVFNFTYSYVCAKISEGSGSQKGPTKWNGMLGGITSGNADIVATATMTPDRLRGPFVFTTPYYTIYGSFITAHPGHTAGLGTLTKPFLLEAWLAIGITLAMIVGTSFYYNKSALKNATFVASILIPYALLVDQGGRTIAKSVRPVIVLWLLFSLIIGNCYKQRLFASITFPLSAQIPTTVPELATMTDYTVLVNYWPTVLWTCWANSTRRDFKNVYDRFHRLSNITTCALSAILEPRTVCIAYAFELQFVMATNLTHDPNLPSGFMTMENYFPSYQHFVLVKSSPYFNSWNWIAANIRDFGLPTKWMNDALEKKRQEGLTWSKLRKRNIKKDLRTTGRPKPVNLVQMESLFRVCLGMIVTSAILFCFELRAPDSSTK